MVKNPIYPNGPVVNVLPHLLSMCIFSVCICIIICTYYIYKNNIYFANFSTPPPLLVVNHMQDTKELIL